MDAEEPFDPNAPIDFENRKTRAVFDQAERRKWCIEQAARAFGMPSENAADLIERAKAIESWLLENKTP